MASLDSSSPVRPSAAAPAGGRGWLGADAPPARRKDSPWRAYALAVAMVVACTLLDQALHGRLAESNLIMVYLLGILPVALRGDWGAAITAAVLGVLAFDFFFVPPFISFAVSDTQYLFTFWAMGMVGVTISSLTARLVAEIAATRQREQRAHALYELSRSLLAAGAAPASVLEEGARVLAAELAMPVGAWLQSPGGEPLPALEAGEALNTSERELLRWAMREGTPAGHGTDAFPGAAHLFLPVHSAKQVHGALGLRFPDGAPPLGADGLAMLETGANQIAIALDHARAREEAELARTRAETEHLRNALLSSVSHDLRTPLAGIVGSASILVDGAEALTPAVRTELAQGIVEEAERLNRLVTNLLQATRLEAGGARLNRDWCSLEDLVAPAIARLGPALAEHPVTVELPEGLPLLYADAALLEQVFVNLLDNAAKHTPTGTAIAVSARREGGAITVTVEDAGPGLPSGSEGRVFEKFRSFGRRGDGGTGLGLSIVRGVVEAHGGRVGADNAPNGGARFRFSLPTGEAPPENAPHA